MSDVPVNEKLYAMVVFQAKAKYRIYPSPGASHWVHRRYLELGGKFEDSEQKSKREAAIKEYQSRLAEKHARGDHDPRKDEKKHKERTGYDKKKKHGDK
jgi:hypothetical protein